MGGEWDRWVGKWDRWVNEWDRWVGEWDRRVGKWDRWVSEWDRWVGEWVRSLVVSYLTGHCSNEFHRNSHHPLQSREWGHTIHYCPGSGGWGVTPSIAVQSQPCPVALCCGPSCALQ